MRKFRFISAVAAAALTISLGFTGCGGAESSSVQEQSTNSSAAEDLSLKKVQDAGKFILGLDATFKPMGFTDENDNIVGFDIDVAEEVCKRMGVELVKQPINWETKETDLDVGKCDCIWNGMSVSPERAEKMNLSDPYMRNSMVFVVKGDNAAETMEDLKTAKIAVQNGSTAQEILEASEIKDTITVTAIATNVEALQQLEMGLVEAVFLDKIVADYEIKTTGKDYKVLKEGLQEEEYAIGFRKNDNALRNEVQKILSEMKADGKLAEISTEWFGSDITTVE